MQNYNALLQDILDNHDVRSADEERTKTGTLSVFSRSLRFDLSDGKFPMVTTRHVSFDIAKKEIAFFLSGKTNINELKNQGVHIWDDWAVTPESRAQYEDLLVERGFASREDVAALVSDTSGEDCDGEIGPMYGHFWRFWPRANDQIHPLEVEDLDINNIPVDVKTTALQNYATFAEPEIESFAEFSLSKYREVNNLPEDAAITGIDIPPEFYQTITPEWNQYKEKHEEVRNQFIKIFYLSTVDQIGNLVMNLKKNPYSRRHIVTAVNPSYFSHEGIAPNIQPLINRGALFPCHIGFQVYVKHPLTEGGKKRLSLQLTIRSWDSALGGPINIAGYALLAHLLANETGMETDELIVNAGDVHIYANQVDLVKEQLKLTPYPLPTIKLKEGVSLFTFKPDDAELVNYQHHPKINYARNV